MMMMMMMMVSTTIQRQFDRAAHLFWAAALRLK